MVEEENEIQSIMTSLEGRLQTKIEAHSPLPRRKTMDGSSSFLKDLRIREESQDGDIDDLFMQGLGDSKIKYSRSYTQKARTFKAQDLVSNLDILDMRYLEDTSEETQNDL